MSKIGLKTGGNGDTFLCTSVHCFNYKPIHSLFFVGVIFLHPYLSASKPSSFISHQTYFKLVCPFFPLLTNLQKAGKRQTIL